MEATSEHITRWNTVWSTCVGKAKHLTRRPHKLYIVIIVIVDHGAVRNVQGILYDHTKTWTLYPYGQVTLCCSTYYWNFATEIDSPEELRTRMEGCNLILVWGNQFFFDDPTLCASRWWTFSQPSTHAHISTQLGASIKDSSVQRKQKSMPCSSFKLPLSTIQA